MDRHLSSTGSTPWYSYRSRQWILIGGVICLLFILAATTHRAQAQETVPIGRGFSLPVFERYAVDDPNAFVYTVRLGEYWILIARKFGIPYAELRSANPELWVLRGELIWPGDEMIIPGLTVADQWETVEYTVQPGDSWYRIADTFGVSYWDLRLDNLGLWRRRGVIIRPGDLMQIVNPSNVAETPESAVESAPTVEPIAAAPTATAPTATAQPADTTAPSATAVPAVAPVTLPPVTGGPPFRVSNPPAGAVVYSVRPGDSWYSIGGRYGMAFETLRSVNQALWALRGQNIRPADEVVIPAHGSPPPPLEIKTAPEDKGAPIAAGGNYSVVEGDSWATIAARAGTTEDALKTANVVLAVRALITGDIVRIP